MTEPTYDEKMAWLCECGHTLEDHHVSWFRGGGMLAEECEYFGTNETGGCEYVDGRWVEHCQRFRRAENGDV